MAEAKKTPKHPFDAFFTAWREFRTAQVQAVLQSWHTVLTIREEVASGRVGNLERALKRLERDEQSNGQTKVGGTGASGTGRHFDESS